MRWTQRALRFETFVLALAVCSLAVAPVTAQGSGSKEEPKKKPVSAEIQSVTVEGRVSDGGSYRGSSSRRSAEAVIIVSRLVDHDGRQLSEYRGLGLRLVENDKLRELRRSESRGEKLIVQGKLHSREKILEIVSFRVAPPAEVEKGSSER